jgi:predicted glycosyltransferase
MMKASVVPRAGLMRRPAADGYGETCARKVRVALYSHDTMGLGHMRRNLLIAQTLMRSPTPPVILMLSGAREAGSLPLPPGVDCFTLPALTKDREGRCRPRDLDLTMPQMIDLRSKALASMLAAFEPDVLIVDKVPRGASRELELSLLTLKTCGQTRTVLGLRDVLDDPETVRREWRESESDEAISSYYDAVWVYGDPALYDPVREYGFSAEVASKVRYTGYLDQALRISDPAPDDDPAEALGLPRGRLILCQVGGGQDGAGLAEAFVKADLPAHTSGVILTGPYLPCDVKARLRAIASAKPRLRVLEFVSEPIRLLHRADRVIAMGGYNTVCEILSFQKPALIVPRIHPRREQWIRAERLRACGLLDLLHPEELTAGALTRWMERDLAPPPSVRGRFNWNGLANLHRFLNDLIAAPPWREKPRLSSCELPQCHTLVTFASATW